MKNRRMPQAETLEGRSLMSAGMAQPGLSASLTVSRATAGAGRAVVLTYTRTNVTGHDITVTDGPSRDGFVVSRGGQVVWRSNSGMTAMFLRQVTLEPGQSIATHATWEETSGAGGVANPTGKFVVASQSDPGGPKATVTITPAHPAGHPRPGR